MRQLYFLVPGTTAQFLGGGLFAELNTLALAQQLCEARIVTYRQRETEHLFLADLLQKEASDPKLKACIFVVGWGFDAPKLIRRLAQYCVVYHAHSAGYGFRVPARVPILTVSRNTLGYWGQQANNGLLYYLPNQISDEFGDRHQPRDIDVLVQARKSSDYVMSQLVPALQSVQIPAQTPALRVQVLNHFVEDLAELFNRTNVYLYDSADYWAVSGVTEGFGLPPLEAIACGCQVFSSVNHGLSDFLDPGFNSHKISAYSTAYDVERILRAIATPPHSGLDLSPYRAPALLLRLETILREINHFFDHQQQHSSDIPALTPLRVRQLWLQQTWRKVKTKITTKVKTRGQSPKSSPETALPPSD